MKQLNFRKGSIKNNNFGITLIALVVTIIVLLILAGISISMLSGDNSILQKATEAKQTTERSEAKEQAKIDIMAWITDKVSKNENSDLDDSKIQEILTDKAYVKEAKASSFITAKGEYEIPYSELYDTTEKQQNEGGTTLGENYSDSWIGKTIDYKSEKNNVNEWIILGKQVNSQGKNDVMITTKNPVGSESIGGGPTAWTGYEEKIKNACKTYIGETGTLGTKVADIEDVRSITMEDIDKAVEYTGTVGTTTISSYRGYPNPSGTGWLKPTDEGYTPFTFANYYSYTMSSDNLNKASNLTYIFANNTSYWVASRAVYDAWYTNFYAGTVSSSYVGTGDYIVCYCGTDEYSNDVEGGAGAEKGLRPVVVLSSEIQWNEVKDLIGNYVVYNNYDSGSGNNSGSGSGYDSGSGYSSSYDSGH